MTTVHPFARTPNKDNEPTPSTPQIPGAFLEEDRNVREEEENALRMMTYGEDEVVRDVLERNGKSNRQNGSPKLLYKRGTRSPPPQGPPPLELPPVPPLTYRWRNASVSSSRTTSSIGHHQERIANQNSPYLGKSPVVDRGSPLVSQDQPIDTPSGSESHASHYDTASSALSTTPVARAPPVSSRRSRVPSKDLLQSALDLAEKAVQCDKANDVIGALAMYRDAVGRLRCVMERVGIELGPLPVGLGLPEPTDAEREDIAQARRRREANGHRSGDEGKILKGIHDAYISRIGLLCVMEHGSHEAGLDAQMARSGQDAELAATQGEQQSSQSSGTSTIAAGTGRVMLDVGEFGGTPPLDEGPPVLPDRVSRRTSLRSGEQLVQAIGTHGSSDFSRASLDADVNAYYPPALHSQPVPRQRTSSRGNAADIQHLQGSRSDPSYQDDPTAAFGSGTGYYHGYNSQQYQPMPSSSRHQSNESYASSSVLGSPTSTITSGSSAKLRADRRLRLRNSSHPSLGVEAEVSDEEADDEEVLDRTPYTEEFPGSRSLETDSVQPNGRLLDRRESNSSSLASSDSSQTRRSSIMLAPKISPRTSSFPPGYADSPDNAGGPPSRATSVSSTRGIKGHNKERSIASVLEEEEVSYEMVDPRTLSSRRTTSLSNSRSPVLAHAYSNQRQAPFPSPGLSNSENEMGSSLHATLPRSRAVSQPAARTPSFTVSDDGGLVPPLPSQAERDFASLTQTAPMLPPPPPPKALTIDTGFPSALGHRYAASNASVSTTTLMAIDSPDTQEVQLESLAVAASRKLNSTTPEPSPAAEPPPINPVHRPFHVLRLLRNTIVSPSGGFLSSRLHIPRAIWSQATVKLVSLDVKVRVIEVLTMSSSSLSRVGQLLLYSEPESRGSSSKGRTDLYACAKEFARVLDDTDSLLDEMEKLLSKKLGLKGFTSSVKSKKLPTSGISVFGSKLTKTFDRIAAGKNVDSPAAYVDCLGRLCLEAQAVDRHLHCFTGQNKGSYPVLQTDLQDHIETRLRRFSDFLSAFVMTFVLQDVGFLLTKYLKQSSKWLEE